MSSISSSTSNSDDLNSTTSTVRNAGKEIEKEVFGSDVSTTSSQLSLRQRLETSQQNSDDDFEDSPSDTFRRKTDPRRRRRNPMFVENRTSTPVARYILCSADFVLG